MKKKKKLFIIIGIVVFIIIIIIINLARGERGIKVDATIAKRDNIISKVRAEGALKALNQVQIGSDVMGRIIELKVNEGDRVKKGDILCIIEQSTYFARLKKVKASLDFARAKLTKAEGDLRRMDELYDNKLISQEQYESEKLSYEMAKTETDATFESYNEAKENYNKTIIKSPVDGEVMQINKEQGEMAVMGTISTPGSVIMTIAERSKMFVKALVDETEVIRINPDQPVKIEVDALPDTTFEGRVIRIGGIPASSGYGYEEAISFPIEVEISGAPERLYPGMSATCEITVDIRDSVIVIPYTAVGRKKIEGTEEDVVFLAKEKNSKVVQVKLGITGENGIEIVDGVFEGDTILTGPYKTLRELEDGEKIDVKLQEPLLGGEEKEKKRGGIRVKVGK
ncbi:efflux RND transporter periplasmic adaptor subunit [candidate division WOR-3 bacterium]|nr:efflux RND transporter periplasmic adaptor subunit [candidate division WOR-3 bacterium]